LALLARTRPEAVLERLAFDQLHDQRRNGCLAGDGCGDFFESVDDSNVRVVQRRERAGFALEAFPPLGVGADEVRQHFDGDLAREPRIAGALDFAHAACANEGNHIVGADS
jgi:hypothetical protein